MAVLVGKPAPDFSLKAVQVDQVIDGYTLSQFKGARYVVIAFYPLDFTFVCPTELHELQARLPEFEALNTQVLGASTDSWFSHLAWLKTPRSQGGIEGVTYPILSDFGKTLSADYDVLLPGGMALRGTFIIDREGIVRSQFVNDLPLGRSVEEILRTLRALQFTEEHGEVCPANWQEGQSGMQPNEAGLRDYFSR